MDRGVGFWVSMCSLSGTGGVSTQRRRAGCLAEGAACVEDLPGTKLMTVAVLSIATRTDFMAVIRDSLQLV